MKRAYISAAIAILVGVLCGAPSRSETSRPAPNAARRAQLAKTEAATAAFRSCMDLPACLAVLDALDPDVNLYGGVEGEDNTIEDGLGHAAFERFHALGAPAKAVLLDRAALIGPGLYTKASRADFFARRWPDWSEADLPALQHVLENNPDSYLADKVAVIGTPTAAAILVASIRPDSNTRGPPVQALAKFGPSILSLIEPILSDPTDGEHGEEIISEIGEPAAIMAPGWASRAVDPRTPLVLRRGLLRGLGAMGLYAHAIGPVIRPLRDTADPGLRDRARRALFTIADISSLPEAIEDCQDEVASQFHDAVACLRHLADYGPEAAPAGPFMTRLLDGDDGRNATAAAIALGYVGYRPAVPRLEAQLSSNDWRRVAGASMALGWMGDPTSLDLLDGVARDYWYPYVQGLARRGADAIRAGGSVVRETLPSSLDYEAFYVADDQFERPLEAPCASGSYSWRGKSFRFAQAPRSFALKLAKGTLSGEDSGEFPSKLTWKPRLGRSKTIVDESIQGAAVSRGGAVAAVGYHFYGTYGYLLNLDIVGASVKQTLIGRLPAAAERGIVSLGDDQFGVLSDRLPVVFDTRQILGVAKCVT